MKFVGDLSRDDARTLMEFGWISDRILEFGSGGSTQIFAQCLPDVLVSVETDPFWIEKTKNNLNLISNKTDPVFYSYEDCPDGEYDLIFVDGIWSKREEFAVKTWPMLSDRGYMIFHDTRRDFDAKNMFDVAARFYNEVDEVWVNTFGSNCSVIKKCPPKAYHNWNETEGKPKWAYGIGEAPEGQLWPLEE